LPQNAITYRILVNALQGDCGGRVPMEGVKGGFYFASASQEVKEGHDGIFWIANLQS